MARIPRVTDIARAVPQDRENINVDFGAGTRALAGAVDDIAGVVQKKQLEDRQSALDNAELEMAITLEKEGRSYDQDSDYGTIRDRSDVKMNDSLSKIASGITDAEDRSDFVNRQRLLVERTRGHLGQVAFNKERDDWRGKIDNQLSEARNASILGDMGQMSGLAKRRLDSAVSKGYYSSEEAEEMYRKWQTSAATGRLETMAPETRLEALKQPWAENLPPDTKIKYQRLAEEELIKGKAQSTVDELMAEPEMTLADGMAVIEKGVKDPDERATTEERFKNEWTTQEAAKQDTDNQTYDKYSLAIMDGGKTDQIPRDDWEGLPTAMRQNLKNMESQQRKPRSVSDPYALQKVIELAAQKDYRGVKSFVSANGSMLSDSDREQYSTVAEKGTSPVGVTDLQAINSLLPGSGYTKTRPKLLPMIADWRNQYVSSTGKEPTPDQRDAELRRMVMDYDRDPDAWIFTNTDPVYDLELAEQDGALMRIHLEQMQEENPEVYDQTKEYLSGQGLLDVDRFDFESAFKSQQVLNAISIKDNKTYTDLEQYFNDRDIQPTHQQFLNAYGKVMEARSVK